MSAPDTLGAVPLASFLFAVFTAIGLLARPLRGPKGLALEAISRARRSVARRGP